VKPSPRYTAAFRDDESEGGGRSDSDRGAGFVHNIGSGAREASVSVRTPEWATVRIGTVSQSPEVCALPSGTSDLGRRLVTLVSFVSPRLVVGAGRAWSTDGRGHWAVFVGLAIAL
jgi:hypothetical protein